MTEVPASSPASFLSSPRKRSIRARVLILLIACAVAPLVIAFAVGQISTRLVGAELTRQTQSDLIALAENRMLRGARGAARLAASEAQQINLVVIVQARAAAAALERSRASQSVLPGDEEPTVYLSREDFDSQSEAIPGIRINEFGRRESDAVSSIVLAPGVDPRAVAPDIRALAGVGTLLPSLRRLNETLIESQFIATATGVHCAFPGHGGYPQDYDPRARIWYEDALTAASFDLPQPSAVRPNWGNPIIDATTHRVIIPVSMVITLSDGSVGGVTGVDIVVRNLVHHLGAEPTWSANEKLLIVNHRDDDQGAAGGLEIYAQLSYDDRGGDWNDAVALDRFTLDDATVLRDLAQELGAGRSGVVRARRDGEDVLCAYAPVIVSGDSAGAALVFTVPFSDFTAISSQIKSEFWSIIVTQLSSNLAIALVVLGAVVFFALKFSARVTRPVKELVSAVDRVATGDLDARADVRTGDELELLADDFNSMIPKLRDRMQLRESLDLAMEVQQSLLPKNPPVVPGLDIEGRSVYCDETGGDYYDFLHIEHNSHLVIALGDVTGHGIAAALLMTTARALVRSGAEFPSTLCDHVTRMNRLLSVDNTHGRFMTLFLLVIARDTGEMRYVAAGHDPAVIYNPRTDSFRELDGEGGIPLGVEGSWVYEEHTAPIIEPGEVLFLGTDGIWEARDADDTLFGKDRMKEVIRTHAGGSMKDLCQAMLDEVNAYRGSIPQLDDITMVAVKAV